MKIGLAIKNFSRTGGGGERYACDLALGLVRLEQEVVVFCARSDFSPPGVTVVPVGSPGGFSALRQWRFNRLLRRAREKHPCDVFYALTECYPADAVRLGGGLNRAWTGLRAAREGGSALIARFLPRSLMKTFIEDRIFRPGSNRLIVLNSRLCLRQALCHYPVPHGRLALVYNGKARVDDPSRHDSARQSVRARLGIPPESVVFLFVANNFHRKGLQTALETLGSVLRPGPGPDLRLVVVGKRSRRDRRFERLVKTCGLTGRVIFTGRVPKPEEYYEAGDVLILPTWYDPFSNVCLEAMCHGLPVLTTPENGASELIRNGENGFICSRPEDWRSAVAAVLDPLVRVRMNTLSLLSSRAYTPEDNAARTLKLLQSVSDRKKLSSGRPVSAPGARLWLADSFRLRRAASSFTDLLPPSGGTTVKENSKRRVTRVELPEGVFYVKEQFPVAAREALKMLLRSEYPFSQARREHRNLLTVSRLGIPTALPAACAWQTRPNGRSILWMRDIGPADRVEDRFKKGLPSTRAARLRAVEEIASIARALHFNGYVHKDFYLGHLFLPRGREEGVVLLDVQRLTRPLFVRRRWRVKDLAALYFSSLETSFTRTECLRFLLRYLGVARLRACDRRLVRAVAAKAARMALHTRKLLARRRAAAAGKGAGK